LTPHLYLSRAFRELSTRAPFALPQAPGSKGDTDESGGKLGSRDHESSRVWLVWPEVNPWRTVKKILHRLMNRYLRSHLYIFALFRTTATLLQISSSSFEVFSNTSAETLQTTPPPQTPHVVPIAIQDARSWKSCPGDYPIAVQQPTGWRQRTQGIPEEPLVTCVGRKSHKGARYQDIMTVSRKVTSNFKFYLRVRWKVWRKEEQKNWTVKHDLCYWMSNEPRITAHFFFTKYNELPNLLIIKESQLQIYV
jgi:hypothetical protein